LNVHILPLECRNKSQVAYKSFEREENSGIWGGGKLEIIDIFTEKSRADKYFGIMYFPASYKD
jgi:hypothetical protein